MRLDDRARSVVVNLREYSTNAAMNRTQFQSVIKGAQHAHPVASQPAFAIHIGPPLAFGKP
ncbi:hypothetical protein HNP73_002269 [Amaricoccus macauensis]|uniref:Uncharacterized protein n=1 Tax=Amaricoccus macauensis TaxID=57001 RepID=A0A840SSM5_9RHOB|nr:hypothetical protein [Amaricoccus macauensis]